MTTPGFPPSQQVPQPHFQALKASLKGSVYFAGDQSCVASAPKPLSLRGHRLSRPNSPSRRFADHSKIFNGAIRTRAVAVAIPEDASDVSKIVVFCNEHRLSPSIKAGGFGTSGVSIGGDIIVDLSRFRGISVDRPDDSIPREYVSLRDQLSPSDKGKGVARSRQPQAALNPGPQDTDLSSVTPQKRGREVEEADDEERVAYEARLRRYDPAAPRVSSFLSGPPLAPEPGVTPRMPPQDYRAPRLGAADSTGSEAAPFDMGGDRQGVYGINPTTMAISESRTDDLYSNTGLGNSPASARGPFDHINIADPPRLPGRVRPFDYLASAGSSQDTGPVLQPTYQQSIQSSRGLASFPTFSSNTPFSGPTFSSLNIPNDLPHSSLYSAGEDSSFPTSPSSLVSPYPLTDWQNPPLDHRSPPQPRYPHVYVSFGAGVLQKEIDMYTADNPVEAMGSATGVVELVPYHVPTAAHPTGSTIMMLGGFGFLSRLHGLSVDNIVEVEMVLADGSIVIVNEEEHPDLWWAIKGAGSCFGVATRYIAKAFPVPVVFAGNLLYRFHKATAPSLIRHFRDCIKQAPRELYANVLLTAGPAGQDSLVVIQMCYVGPKEKGMEYLQAISSWDGEGCLLNEVNEKAFLNQQDSVAQVLRAKAGRQWFIRSMLITSLPDDIINKTVLEFADTPIGCTWLFELAGGAIGDFENSCLPKEQREATFNVAALHQWDLGIDDPKCVYTAENWLDKTLKPVAQGGPFPSFLGRGESPEMTKASFGKNWDRLVELKRRYDPTNLFRNTFWPLDEEGNILESSGREPEATFDHVPKYLPDDVQRNSAGNV
ncbi:hypothetical protein BJ322DRAFT_888554 [Thelephora terrestris]|uniref:FAD-binding PCMH-type domain-containing protein n=1 Tax=Thelephora terrestris TaxID=56493 RepID=A0A9P6HED1_9AGAM|nr:hypothetical protein BJ322DRAFT_888554 [Thelephora terrestris]